MDQVFYNDRYKISMAFDVAEMDALDEYRNDVLFTVGIKENSAAWMYGQWFPTAQPVLPENDDDAWMADYFKRKYKIDGNGYLVTNIGFVFHRLNVAAAEKYEPDNLFYIIDRDFEAMAQKGHVFDADHDAMDSGMAVGAVMRLYGDMQREIIKEKWNTCPMSQAHSRFLPTFK